MLFEQGGKPTVSMLSPSLPSQTWPLTSDLAGHRKQQHRILTLFCMPTAWKRAQKHAHTHNRAYLLGRGWSEWEREWERGKGCERSEEKRRGGGVKEERKLVSKYLRTYSVWVEGRRFVLQANSLGQHDVILENDTYQVTHIPHIHFSSHFKYTAGYNKCNTLLMWCLSEHLCGVFV